MVEYFHKLGDGDKFVRLRALKELVSALKNGTLPKVESCGGICNHICTTYSFSPYTPSKAAFMAYMSGLETVGIVDRDGVGGAKEFLAACDMLGVPATVGSECVVNVDKTPLKDMDLNVKEQPSTAKCVLHGIPHQNYDRIADYFSYYSEKRVERLKIMAEKYNEIMAGYGIALDFDKDVSSLASVSDGGVVTEEHLLLAMANKILEKYDKGNDTVDFFLGEMEYELTDDRKKFLTDKFNPGYELDMADVLRQELESLWVNAHDECPEMAELSRVAHETGSLLVYPYEGENDGITAEELLSTLKSLGFHGVSVAPSRLSPDTVSNILSLCEKYELLPVSGEFVSRPRDTFVYSTDGSSVSEMLKLSSWAIIGHEKAASVNVEFGMFSPKIIAKFPTLRERIDYFSSLAKKCQSADF